MCYLLKTKFRVLQYKFYLYTVSLYEVPIRLVFVSLCLKAGYFPMLLKLQRHILYIFEWQGDFKQRVEKYANRIYSGYSKQSTFSSDWGKSQAFINSDYLSPEKIRMQILMNKLGRNSDDSDTKYSLLKALLPHLTFPEPVILLLLLLLLLPPSLYNIQFYIWLLACSQRGNGWRPCAEISDYVIRSMLVRLSVVLLEPGTMLDKFHTHTALDLY
jgi:hypothetical protein